MDKLMDDIDKCLPIIKKIKLDDKIYLIIRRFISNQDFYFILNTKIGVELPVWRVNENNKAISRLQSIEEFENILNEKEKYILSLQDGKDFTIDGVEICLKN